MKAELCNQKQLAARLGVTARRIYDLEQEGVIARQGGRYDAARCERAYRWYRDHDVDAVCGEIERVAAGVQASMDGLLAIDDIEKRRELAKGVGPQIQDLDRLMTLAAALSPAGAKREFERQWAGMVIGRTLGELLAACRLKFAAET